MATWATDVRGLNLAHHAPTAAERRMARIIAKRWSRWQPILLLELRRHPQPPGYVAQEMLRMGYIHSARVHRLMDHYQHTRCPAERLNQTKLDDPRLSDDEFNAKLAVARHIRQSCKGRYRNAPAT
jgi:hypothetical protein